MRTFARPWAISFPKHIYHTIVCIGALVAHRESERWALDALGAPHVGVRSEQHASFVGDYPGLDKPGNRFYRWARQAGTLILGSLCIFGWGVTIPNKAEGAIVSFAMAGPFQAESGFVCHIQEISKGDVAEDPKKLFGLIERQNLAGFWLYHAGHIESDDGVFLEDCVRGIRSNVAIFWRQWQLARASCDLPFQASGGYLGRTSPEIHKPNAWVGAFWNIFVNLEVAHSPFSRGYLQTGLANDQDRKFDVYGGISGALCGIGSDPSRTSQTNRKNSEHGSEDCDYQRTERSDNSILVRDISADAMSVRWDRSDENGDAFFKMLGAWVILSVAFYALLKIQ
jgi:hypothetical protein